MVSLFGNNMREGLVKYHKCGGEDALKLENTRTEKGSEPCSDGENTAESAVSLEDMYTFVNHRKLRFGYTTGSCAAAAAKTAAIMLFEGKQIETVELLTPANVQLHLEISEKKVTRYPDGSVRKVLCGIYKDGGDDVDHTSGALICAEVGKIEKKDSEDADPAETVKFSENPESEKEEKLPEDWDDIKAEKIWEKRDDIKTEKIPKDRNAVKETYVVIDGGNGVGRVTRPGLDQEPGQAAINSVPRKMIREAVLDVCGKAGYRGGVSVVISVPDGERIAEKTFNGNLGIVGGISILGTSGIVRPMSRKAMIDSMRVEMNALCRQGGRHLLISPGNYGEEFAKVLGIYDMRFFMQCSNYVGEVLEMAEELEVESILFAAHIGKFIKVAGGIMNTHSGEADARMEILASCAVRAGAGIDTVREILNSNTTEDALAILKNGGQELFERTMEIVVDKIMYYLARKCGNSFETGVILFSGKYGKLGESENAAMMAERLKRQKLP